MKLNNSLILPIAIIIILVVLVVNLDKIFPSQEQNIDLTTTQQTQEQITLSKTCLEENNIKENTIIFLYSNTCSYCKSMMPIVKKLESQGYNFYWANVASPASAAVIDCISDVIQGGVPEFICTKTKDFKLGAIPEKELVGFADKCLS